VQGGAKYRPDFGKVHTRGRGLYDGVKIMAMPWQGCEKT